MIYVLIMMMSNAVHTHEFNSLRDCENAGKAFYESGPSGHQIGYVCVEKSMAYTDAPAGGGEK